MSNELGKALEPFIKEVVSDHVDALDIENKINEKLEVIAQKASKVIEVKLTGKEKKEKLPLVHKVVKASSVILQSSFRFS